MSITPALLMLLVFDSQAQKLELAYGNDITLNDNSRLGKETMSFYRLTAEFTLAEKNNFTFGLQSGIMLWQFDKHGQTDNVFYDWDLVEAVFPVYACFGYKVSEKFTPTTMLGFDAGCKMKATYYEDSGQGPQPYSLNENNSDISLNIIFAERLDWNFCPYFGLSVEPYIRYSACDFLYITENRLWFGVALGLQFN